MKVLKIVPNKAINDAPVAPDARTSRRLLRRYASARNLRIIALCLVLSGCSTTSTAPPHPELERALTCDLWGDYDYGDFEYFEERLLDEQMIVRDEANPRYHFKANPELLLFGLNPNFVGYALNDSLGTYATFDVSSVELANRIALNGIDVELETESGLEGFYVGKERGHWRLIILPELDALKSLGKSIVQCTYNGN